MNGLSRGIHVRLLVMMFLQYAVWGTWFMTLGGYVGKYLGFAGWQIGWLYALLPLANIVVPFTGGQIADRWLPTQVALGIFHLAGAAVCFVLAYVKSYPAMMTWLAVYCLLYAPTLALTNSLAFRNLRDPQREFGIIRVGGTIGWIAAGWLLTLLRRVWGTESPQYVDFFLLGGVLSALLGVYCFTLPPTPPAKEGRDPLAFREALVLFKDRSYLVFFIIAFVVATELQLYYVLTFPYLEIITPVIGLKSSSLPAVMTVAQVAEIVTMTLLLPWAMPKWGVRKCMLVGMIAWPIRYIIFAATYPLYKEMPVMVWLTIGSLVLHGFCYVFFFVVAFIYTDMVAPKDIRASAQALINVAVLGIGLFVGSKFAGWLSDLCTDAASKTVNYGMVFAVPAVITVICAVVFAILFHGPQTTASTERTNT